jgi:hypothetical protein
MATEDGKKQFLQTWQSGRSIDPINEDELSDMMLKEQLKGNFTESEMDGEVACGESGSSTGSLGAGPCILGFIRAVAPDGQHRVASIQVGLDGSKPLTPEAAYELVIKPLEDKITEKLGNVQPQTSYYFAGGNPDTFNSCVALAFEAQRLGINVPVSMLGINRDDDENINAMMTCPTNSLLSGNFYIARAED